MGTVIYTCILYALNLQPIPFPKCAPEYRMVTTVLPAKSDSDGRYWGPDV